MSRTLKVVLAINLIVLALLAFAYPHLMVGPGKLTPGHSKLETDCFACHAPLAGASTERCTACHKPADIGKRSTLGQAIQHAPARAPFHQQLVKQDCLGCHSDHAGVKRLRTQGQFNHALLQPMARQQCQTCHQAPNNTLHKGISGNCSQCHAQEKWVPASFDHNKLFLLDRDHNVSCVSCHTGHDYSRYTCYGCHEHTPEKIRREHMEEGISDFKNCATCHRSANEHDIRMPGRAKSRD